MVLMKEFVLSLNKTKPTTLDFLLSIALKNLL